MEKMTHEERIAYSHGRIRSDIEAFRRAMKDMQQTLIIASRIWIVALVTGLLILLAVTIVLGQLTTLFDIIYVVIVIVTFFVMRFIALHVINDMLRISNLLTDVLNALANDTTLKLGFEDIELEDYQTAEDTLKSHSELPPDREEPGHDDNG